MSGASGVSGGSLGEWLMTLLTGETGVWSKGSQHSDFLSSVRYLRCMTPPEKCTQKPKNKDSQESLPSPNSGHGHSQNVPNN